MLVREIPIEERPREKAMKYGVKSLSNNELLAILIRTGYQGGSSINVAEQVIAKANGLSGLGKLQFQDMIAVKGVKQVKALELLACFELARRMTLADVTTKDIIENKSVLVNWLKHEIGNLTQEHFLVVYLDTQNRIINYRQLFIGTIDHSEVNAREVFKEALLVNSRSIILVHNHPSGVVQPSKADIELTNQMVICGELMGVCILDHVIVSNSETFSFKEHDIIS